MAKPETRQAHLAAIHMAQKALGLSTEDASALKLAVTGVASSGDMTAPQRRHYLAHLSGLQAHAATARGQKPAYQPVRPALYRATDDSLDERWHKARALWAELGRAGQVHTDTDAALMAYVKRQTHVEHWRFLNTAQINSVIEALKRWCLRCNVPTRPVAEEEKTHG
jgi:hypothetical protein